MRFLILVAGVAVVGWVFVAVGCKLPIVALLPHAFGFCG